MSKNRELKVQVVADIVEQLKNAESVVICSYSGLTVEQVTALRKECRENEVNYVVLKNRLVARALAELNITGLDDLLNGPNAFVFGGKDVTNAPKIINTFIEKNKLNSLKITGGLMGTEVLDVNKVKALSELPSKEVLLSRLVGSIQAPVAKLVYFLEALRKQQAGEE